MPVTSGLCHGIIIQKSLAQARSHRHKARSHWHRPEATGIYQKSPGTKTREKKGSFYIRTRVRNTEFLALRGKMIILWGPRIRSFFARARVGITKRNTRRSRVLSGVISTRRWAKIDLMSGAPQNEIFLTEMPKTRYFNQISDLNF